MDRFLKSIGAIGAIGGATAIAIACTPASSPPQAPMTATDVPVASASSPSPSSSTSTETPVDFEDAEVTPVALEPLPAPSGSASLGPPSLPPMSAGGPPFDRGAAAQALGAVNAQSCAAPNGPTGAGHATVEFDPSGNVSSATVDAGPFPGTAVGGCVAGLFRGIHVPAFAGPSVRVGKSFAISSGPVASPPPRRTAAAPPPPPPPPRTASVPAASGAPFDRGAAAAALGAVNVNSCATPNGMRGVGHVTVTFTDSGKVKAATVDSGPFTGTLMGACLASLFRNARVRPFTGPDVRVGKSFDVR